MRKLTGSLLLAAALVMLAGCESTNGACHVNPDGTVSCTSKPLFSAAPAAAVATPAPKQPQLAK
jgi:uncharacterized lipoprotein YajG